MTLLQRLPLLLTLTLPIVLFAGEPTLREVCASLADVAPSLEFRHRYGDPLKPFAGDVDFKQFPDIRNALEIADAETRLKGVVQLFRLEGPNPFGNSELNAAQRKEIRTALVPLLNDIDLDVRRAALYAVVAGNLYSRAAFEPVLKHIASEDPVSRALALRAAAAFGRDDARILPELAKGLTDRDARIVGATLAAAVHLKKKAQPLAPAIQQKLEIAPPEQQLYLLKVLAEMEAPGLATLLPKFLESKTPEVREAALDALLGSFPAGPLPDGLPLMLPLFKDNTLHTRLTRTVRTLGFHAREALPYLFEVPAWGNPPLRQELEEAIEAVVSHRYRGGWSDQADDGKPLVPAQLSEDVQRDAVRRITPYLKTVPVLAAQAVACFEKVPLSPDWVNAVEKLLDSKSPVADQKEGLIAFQYAGSRAIDFLPMLRATVAHSPQLRTNVIQALKAMSVDHEPVQALLLEWLGADVEAGKALASTAGGRARLVNALASAELQRRQNASRGLAAGGITPPEAAPELWKLAQESEPSALECLYNLNDRNNLVAQMEVLRSLMGRNSLIRTYALNLTERLGPAALPLRDALLNCVLEQQDGWTNAIPPLAACGVDTAGAEKLADLPADKEKLEQLCLLPLLKAHPEHALAFFKARSSWIRTSRDFSLEAMYTARFFFGAFSGLGHEHDALLKLAAAQPDLNFLTIAAIGHPDLLPQLDAEMAKADPHMKFLLQSCARACGRPDGRLVVRISMDNPTPFRPKSAWPNSDPDRMDRHAGSHGDGATPIVITGTLKCADGTPPTNPKFFGINDRYLLGRREKKVEGFKYDAKTGRFVLYSEVFAAYQGGEEPGPYQTGSAQTLIESESSDPFEVQFFDEMPDVEVILPARKPK